MPAQQGTFVPLSGGPAGGRRLNRPGQQPAGPMTAGGMGPAQQGQFSGNGPQGQQAMGMGSYSPSMGPQMMGGMGPAQSGQFQGYSPSARVAGLFGGQQPGYGGQAGQGGFDGLAAMMARLRGGMMGR